MLYLTGGVPIHLYFFINSEYFFIIKSKFKTNSLLVLLTIITNFYYYILFTRFACPISDHFHVSPYYFYSIPIALIIALIFLNYLAMSFGTQSRLRREALAKMEEVMATEHELLSLGGQAAAAAHSLGTPLSTIKIIAHDLRKTI